MLPKSIDHKQFDNRMYDSSDTAFATGQRRAKPALMESVKENLNSFYASLNRERSAMKRSKPRKKHGRDQKCWIALSVGCVERRRKKFRTNED